MEHTGFSKMTNKSLLNSLYFRQNAIKTVMRLSLLLYFFLALIMTVGCSTTKKAGNSKEPHIVKAGYHHWSHTPLQQATVPEKGTDLALIVKNLPKGAEPQSIIYNHYKSFRPTITDTTKKGIVMNARIVVASSVLQHTSPRTDLSDRLIYQKADSSTHFIEIKGWVKIKE